MDSCLFQITVEKLPKPSRLAVLLNRYTTDPRYQQLFINLVRPKPTLKTNISSMNNVFVIFSHLFMMAVSAALIYINTANPGTLHSQQK